MYKRYYGGYDDCSEAREEILPCPCKNDFAESGTCLTSNEKKLFGNFEADDLLLICIFLFLLMEQCEDKLVLALIGFVLISGIGD